MFEDDIGLKPFNRLNLTLPLKRQAIDSAGCKHLYFSTLDRYVPTSCSFYALKPIASFVCHHGKVGRGHEPFKSLPP